MDVPTVLFYALLQQRTAEQPVNTPRLGGRLFPGSLPGQVSTASVAEQTVDIPVLGRGGFHSDQKGFLPVHNPSAQSAEQIVDSSVPRGRGRRSQGFLPGQSSTARCEAVSSTARRGVLVRGGGDQGSVPGRADVRGRFRGRVSVPLGSRSWLHPDECGCLSPSPCHVVRLLSHRRVSVVHGSGGSRLVMEADDIEFGLG